MHDQYSTYDIAAFLADPGFVAWVKYGEENAFWAALLTAFPHQRETVEQAGAIILAAAASQPLHYPEEAERRRMWANIITLVGEQDAISPQQPAAQVAVSEDVPAFAAPALAEGPAETPDPAPRKPRRYVWYAAAAAVLAGIVAIPFTLQHHSKPDNYAALLRRAGLPAAHRTEALNDTQKPLWVSLPDGSSAVLAPGSRLSFADDFSHRDQREVYLSGAAFFEVDKRAAHPFVVYANALAIKVLGTSFSVTAPNDKPDVQVQVKSGKVLLYQEHHSLVVNARQQAALSKGQLYLTTQTVDSAKQATTEEFSPLAAAEQIPLTFEDASIPEVFAALEAAYGITIHYDKTKGARCRLTAFLSDEPLPEKIRLICKAIQAPYEINGSDVTINIKTCK